MTIHRGDRSVLIEAADGVSGLAEGLAEGLAMEWRAVFGFIARDAGAAGVAQFHTRGERS